MKKKAKTKQSSPSFAKALLGPRLSMLVQAVRDGKNDEAIKLMDVCKGALDTQQWNMTLLGFAAHLGNEELVAALLERGCDPNLKDSEGIAPILHACETAQTGVLRLLLAAGARADATNKHGRTALFATAPQSVECTELVLQAGCDPAARDSDGCSALSFARRYWEQAMHADPRPPLLTMQERMRIEELLLPAAPAKESAGEAAPEAAPASSPEAASAPAATPAAE